MATPVTPDDLGTWARALGFSLEALAMNRKGLVAPEQLKGFGADVIRSAIVSGVFIVSAVTISFVVKPWWRWLAVVGLLGLAALFVVQGVHTARDHSHPEVLSVEGKPSFSGGYRHSVILRIGSKTFSFPERTNGQDTESLFPEDRVFRLYYLRGSGRPLSAEPLPERP